MDDTAAKSRPQRRPHVTGPSLSGVSQWMAFGLQASRRHSHPRPCCPPLRSCVSRCTRVSHTWCCWRRLAGATTYWSSSGGQLGSSTSMAPPSFGCMGGYQAHRHPRVRIVQAPSGTEVMCHPQVHTTRWHTASSFHVNTHTRPIQFCLLQTAPTAHTARQGGELPDPP